MYLAADLEIDARCSAAFLEKAVSGSYGSGGDVGHVPHVMLRTDELRW